MSVFATTQNHNNNKVQGCVIETNEVENKIIEVHDKLNAFCNAVFLELSTS